MILRRLNAAGVDAFRQYLHHLREDPAMEPPKSLLEDQETSEPLDIRIDVDPPARFDSRMAFARWLHAEADGNGKPAPRLDRGFWAWLSLALFDHVCPPGRGGSRTPGADSRHIPDEADWRRRYRHLLANPYDVYLLHRDDPGRAYVALVNPLHTPGELTEQFTSRIEVVSCPGTMTLASYLFVDPATGQRRRGASGGAARRFGKLMNQYTRTWDLPEISAPDFARLLPREFSKFRASAEKEL